MQLGNGQAKAIENGKVISPSAASEAKIDAAISEVNKASNDDLGSTATQPSPVAATSTPAATQKASQPFDQLLQNAVKAAPERTATQNKNKILVEENNDGSVSFGSAKQRASNKIILKPYGASDFTAKGEPGKGMFFKGNPVNDSTRVETNAVKVAGSGWILQEIKPYYYATKKEVLRAERTSVHNNFLRVVDEIFELSLLIDNDDFTREHGAKIASQCAKIRQAVIVLRSNWISMNSETGSLLNRFIQATYFEGLDRKKIFIPAGSYNAEVSP